MDKLDTMKSLIAKMNEAAYYYYQLDNPIVSDKRYDEWYDQLQALEKETGIISRNIKLVSFEYLSRVVEDPFDTNLLDRRDKIRKVITEKTIANFDSLRTALFKVGVEFQDELDIVYGNIEPGGFRYS